MKNTTVINAVKFFSDKIQTCLFSSVEVLIKGRLRLQRR